jgi:hypothetical protein
MLSLTQEVSLQPLSASHFLPRMLLSLKWCVINEVSVIILNDSQTIYSDIGRYLGIISI